MLCGTGSRWAKGQGIPCQQWRLSQAKALWTVGQSLCILGGQIVAGGIARHGRCLPLYGDTEEGVALFLGVLRQL